jgi:hypothetical protein
MQNYPGLAGIWLLVAPAMAVEPAPPSEAGFVTIFDGTLKDWQGDPVYWKVQLRSWWHFFPDLNRLGGISFFQDVP